MSTVTEENSSSQMLTGSLMMVLMRWAIRGLGFVNTIVLVRLLQPSDFGVLAIATIISGFFEVFSETGQRLAIIRHPNPDAEVLNSAWTVQVMICTVLAILVFLSAPLAEVFFHEPHAPGVVRLLALRALIMGFENIGTVVFRRNLNFTREFKYNVYQRLVTVILTIIFAVVLRNYWALAIGMVTGQAAAVVVSYAMNSFRPWFGFSKVRELWSFSLWILAGQVTSYFQGRIDQIALGPVTTATRLGEYFVASDVATMPISEVLIPMGRAQYPVYVRMARQPEALRRAYLESLSLTAVLAWATGIGLALVSHDFAAVVLGAKWIALAPLMPLLCISAALFALTNTALTLHQACGGAAEFARQSWVRTLIMGVLIYFAAQGGNLMHVVIARFASALVFTPIVFLTIRRVIDVGLMDVWQENQRPAIASLGMSAVILALQHVIPETLPLLRLMVCILAGGAAFTVILLWLWRIGGRPAGIEAQVVGIFEARLTAGALPAFKGSRYRARAVAAGAMGDADRAEWDRLLAAQHPLGNAFLSSTFSAAAARAWPSVKACFIEDGGGTAAILPFQSTSMPARLWHAGERVGEELNDYFGVIARSGFSTSPAEILTLTGCNYLAFSHLGEEQREFGLTGQQPRTGLRIELPDGGEAYWTQLVAADKKFAADSGRRLRKAEEQFGPMRFCMQEAEPGKLLLVLLAHKRAQYARTGKADALAAPGRNRLLTLLAEADAPDCTGCLSTLYFGDTWAAMHFGLKSRQTLHYWFPVYNPELNSLAPGRLLLREIIRQAQPAGIAVIDRGEGESAAKKDFPSTPRIYFTDAWYRGNAAAWCYRAQQALRRQLRARPATQDNG